MTVGSPAPLQACPPGPEQPLAQRAWHQPAPGCPVQGPARHTSHTFGSKWPLRDSPGHFPLSPSFIQVGNATRPSLCAFSWPSGGRAGPSCEKGLGAFPSAGHTHPQVKGRLPPRPAGPLPAAVASGPPQGSSPGPPGWPQVPRGSGRGAAHCRARTQPTAGPRQVSGMSVAEEHAGARQGVGIESFLLFSRRVARSTECCCKEKNNNSGIDILWE